MCESESESESGGGCVSRVLKEVTNIYSYICGDAPPLGFARDSARIWVIF